MTNALWYLGRGTGVTALVLFSLVMVLGIVVRSGRSLPGLPRFAVSAIHRSTSLTALVLLTIHVVTLMLDPFAQLRLVDLVVPFQGAYRPLWLGFGTLTADIALALVITSLLRDRIGRRAWRAIHWAAYACWPLAVAHALGNGTDRSTSWLVVTVGCCVTAVLSALAWRVWLGSRNPTPVAGAGAAPLLTEARS